MGHVPAARHVLTRLVLALALLAGAAVPARADPICQYLALKQDGVEQELLNPCAGYGGDVECDDTRELTVDQSLAVVVVICYPDVIRELSACSCPGRAGPSDHCPRPSRANRP